MLCITAISSVENEPSQYFAYLEKKIAQLGSGEKKSMKMCPKSCLRNGECNVVWNVV